MSESPIPHQKSKSNAVTSIIIKSMNHDLSVKDIDDYQTEDRKDNSSENMINSTMPSYNFEMSRNQQSSRNSDLKTIYQRKENTKVVKKRETTVLINY